MFFNSFDLPIVEKENKIGTEEDILDLWTTFQTKAFGLVSQANNGQRMPAILWTNTMTEKGAEKYVSKEDYIIQVCIVIVKSYVFQNQHRHIFSICFPTSFEF